jgi:4'-phosphopantetheinyl transferase
MINTVTIKKDQIHLWVAYLSRWETRLNEMESLLDPSERIRAERLVIPKRRYEFILQRGILRSILSPYVDDKPERIQISASEDGKPFLPGNIIQFNLSHSNDLMVCGITSGTRIGVDIQHLYQMENFEQVMAKILTPSEMDLMHDTPENEKQELFFSIWTAKEAYLKALGTGLRTKVNAIQICWDQMNGAIFQIDDPADDRDWFIQEIEIESGYKSFLVVEGKEIQVERRDFFPETTSELNPP